MDAGGGQDPGRAHPELRPQQLARAAQASRAAAVRQELPAPVDQLPAPGHQARQLHLVVRWRRRRLGLLARSVHEVRRRAPTTAAGLERARAPENFQFPG
ncbi:myb domain protein 15 [Zea mays]|uniref:Myb domain protein 15 n=1 Tax=Zea mays TaxID=4577 RepID=A0A1D6JAI2_MAIZE|nr:myb domain protein 15 [Zea mays]